MKYESTPLSNDTAFQQSQVKIYIKIISAEYWWKLL